MPAEPLAALLRRTLQLLVLLTPALVTGAAAQDSAGGREAPVGAAGSAAPAGPEPGAPAPGRVGYAHVHGVIDRMRERYLERAVETAAADGIDTLIVHIDTDGGAVANARDMFKRVLDQSRQGLRMVAFIDYRAISAGAMIAYAHDAIYMAETASIGDIGVVYRSPEGEIKYAPEKIETVIRSLLVQAAEQRGWSRGLLLKMTAHKQKLYRIALPDGAVHFVIEDDLPDFLLRHPQVDPEDKRQVIVYRGEDRLLTLTGREAVKLGMATGNVADLEALYAELGVEPAAVADYAPRFAELTAWTLAGVAPLLAGLAMLFVLFELKTPGVGIWALLAAVFGAAFLFAQYYLDMVENIELLMMIAGTALLAMEVLTAVGGGALALLGGGLVFTGLVLAFVPNEFAFDLSDEAFQAALTEAALSATMALGVVAFGMIVVIRALPRSNLYRRIGVLAEVTATSGGALAERTASLAGARGVAREALHPSGAVIIDGRDYSARAEHGAYLDAGAAVEVVKIEFGELVVRGVGPATADTGNRGGDLHAG